MALCEHSLFYHAKLLPIIHTDDIFMYRRNETLRLYAPIPTGIQRAPEPGSGGKLLQGGSSANV
jgi:hypothetical protein